MQRRRLEIERDLIDAGSIDLRNFVVIVLEKLQRRVREPLNGVKLAILHSHSQSIAVSNALDGNFIHLRLDCAPIIFIRDEVNLRIGNLDGFVRAGADNDIILDAFVNVDNATVWVA